MSTGTSDSVPWITFDLPDLPRLDFYEQRQLRDWIDGERERWSWLWSAETTLGSLGTRQFQGHQNALNQLADRLSNEIGKETQPYNELRNLMVSTFNPSQANSLFASETPIGKKILSIEEQFGPDMARWAFRLEKGEVNLSQVNNNVDLRLVLGAALFDEDVFGEFGAALKKERSTYRGEITKLENRVRQLEEEKSAATEALHNRVRKLTRRLLRQTRDVWDRKQSSISESVTKALGSITETEDKYRNQMALQAPVEYWRKKAKSHAIWEGVYSAVCLTYFGAAAYVIVVAAMAAIAFLQGFTGQAQTSAYIITAGALLGGTTLLFWLGRVVVKLFLSEHHLRADCSEKAIMTQAFLSMATQEGSFGETDRAIILASIFRSSPDGIVKDEGPSDIAGNALLARLLSR